MMKDNDIKQAERQVAWALVRMHKPAFTYDELRELHMKQDTEDELRDWTGVFNDFITQGYLQQAGEECSLTATGKDYTETLRGEDFGVELVQTDESKVYGQWCELLYGKNLGQYSMVTMEQLDMLLGVLQLDSQSRVLDIGCGVGRVTEYIADVTGAKVTGLDFAGPAIRRAQERTTSKAERVRFVQGSMDRMDLPESSFDAVISLDTFYFATDLRRTLEQIEVLLRRPGQIGLFWSQMVPDAEALEKLQPDKTRVATTLSAMGLTFHTYDFTAAEKQHWQRTMDLLEELKPAFDAEGSTQLYEGRLAETQRILEFVKDDRISRYLYHIQM